MQKQIRQEEKNEDFTRIHSLLQSELIIVEIFTCNVSSMDGYDNVVTNQSAAKFLSTNQNRAFSPCDFCDVTPIVLTHVTPRNKEHTHTRVESALFA